MYGLLPVLTVVHLLEYYSTKSGRFFPPYRQIGDFRVAFRLSFKASLSAEHFIWKVVLFTCKWTNITGRDFLLPVWWAYNNVLYNVVALAPTLSSDKCPDCHSHAQCVLGKCVCVAGFTGDGNMCEGIYSSFDIPIYVILCWMACEKLSRIATATTILLLLLLLPTVKTSFTRKKLVTVALVSNKSIQKCNTSRSN